jgi:hypothetical protein
LGPLLAGEATQNRGRDFLRHLANVSQVWQFAKSGRRVVRLTAPPSSVTLRVRPSPAKGGRGARPRLFRAPTVEERRFHDLS